MTKDETHRAAAVAGASSPPQAADIRNRWWWVEPSVWTERMLTRLEQSEPTTKWFRLWDKVLSERNLRAAFRAVWRNGGAPGVDGQTVQQFDQQSEPELARLRDELKTAGQVAPADEADQRTRPERDPRAGESHPAGLARLLPGQSPDGPEKTGRVAAATPAGAAAQTGETAWLRAE